MRTNEKGWVAIASGLLIISGVFWFRARAAEASLYDVEPAISLVQAVETVLAANPGTKAIDATLEHENNVLAWEIELDNDLEVYIDANTNQIIQTEQTWGLDDVPFLRGMLPN